MRSSDVFGGLVLAQVGAQLRLGALPQADEPQRALEGVLIGVAPLKRRDALRVEACADLEPCGQDGGQAERVLTVQIDVDPIRAALLDLDGGDSCH